MAALPQSLMTLEEYFQLEESSEIRHEYYHGRVFAMAGASEKHNDIVSSVQFSLYGQTRGRNCKVRASDMRVGIKAADFYTYPDVVIVCGKRELDHQLPNTLLNPTVLVEVLSPSTAAYDHGDKFEAYRTLDSLQEYLLISQNSVRVEHYVRQGDAWLFTETTRLEDTIMLPSIDCTLLVSDIYEKVDFNENDLSSITENES
jgi:Uma2 family endonuclease